MTPKILAESVLAEYLQDGWQLQPSKDAKPILGFEPDFLLKKGNSHLVVEVKRPGTTSTPSVAELRKKVESRPNWHFEVKLLPPRKISPNVEIAANEVAERLTLIQRLRREGRTNEAIVLAWIVIETCVRQILAMEGEPPTLELSKLIRKVYEADKITPPELHQIREALELRNRIVHGFKAQADQQSVRSTVGLARALAKRIESRVAKHAPVG